MMKMYICPKCGWLRAVSRRSEVECFKCGSHSMVPLKLSYQEFSQMNPSQREEYKKSWLYLHPGKNIQ